MRRLLLGLALGAALVCALLVFSLWPPAPLTLPAPGVVLNDVTLIEPGVGRRSGQRLVVAGDRLARIEPARPASGEALTGVYVLPGLNDVHAHFPPASIPGQTELFAFLFLYHGVTGVRDPGDIDGTSAEPARRGIAEGAFPGPRLLQCGPFVDGDSPRWGNSLVADSPASARAAAQRVAAAGFGCIKAYERLSAASLAALRDEARKLGLPVIGHVPYDVPYPESRLDDAQHLLGVPRPVSADYRSPIRRYEDWLAFEDERMEEVVAAALEAGTAHTPTLVTIETISRLGDHDAMRAEPSALLLPRVYRDVVWSPLEGVSPARRMGPEDFALAARIRPLRRRVVKRMHDAGVELRSGTDTLVAFLVPGAALHRELRLLVLAGLTPEQALAVSTRNSARVFGVPGLGSLREGAPAELSIFRRDPTESLSALDDLAGVVRGGRFYSREALDAQLERYRAYADGAVYDGLLTFAARQLLGALAP